VQESNHLLTGRYSIPITLSSLASSYLKSQLVDNKPYHDPKDNEKYGLKNLSKVFTPTGVELARDLPMYISYFLGSYHGGRNESYIYGIVRETVYDYDLPGAYPTAMSLLDYPDWERKEVFLEMSGEEFMENYKKYLFRSYTALKVEFSFPETVQYPTLPVRLNESSIIYPLSGVSYCTGHEILLASKFNCEFKVIGGVFIPFKNLKFHRNAQVLKTSKHAVDRLLKETSDGKPKVVEIRNPLFDVLENHYTRLIFGSKPVSMCTNVGEVKSGTSSDFKTGGTNFFNTVKKLVVERNRYKKGTYMNQLYKFLANSGIGQMARGLNQKKAFDTKSLKPELITPGDLISPLYAGWITSYIRCTLTEILNNSSDEYKIFSCTTDGFISTQKGLELIEPVEEDIFSYQYFKARESLTGKGELLEVKHFDTKGLLS